MKATKMVLMFLVMASPALAQDQVAAARTAAGCGPTTMEFTVHKDKKQHPAMQPDAGKALVYVFETVKSDDLGFHIGGVTTKVGLDGTWVGATQTDSYMVFPVDAGDHRVCANWQSSMGHLAKLASAASFTAQPGQIFYFRTKVHAITNEGHGGFYDLNLEPVDPAEAQLLIANLSYSTSQAKK
jgi:hypothetical protein